DLCGPLIATALKLPRGASVQIVNYRLGTALISYLGGKYEYTPFRVEKYDAGGAHTPVEVRFTTSLAGDAVRRDFTVNSIYVNAATGEVSDPTGGIADIERKVLRAHDPALVFASDGLRLMRLVRLAAETGFKIDGATGRAAMVAAENLKDISGERKREELMRILTADTKYGIPDAHYRGLKLLQKLGLLKYVIAPLAEGEGLMQNPAYHKFDVLEHTFRTVRHAPPHLRLAALMHDIGKPYVMQMYGNAHGHEIAGETITRDILGRELHFSSAVVNRTAELVRYHMYDMDGKTREGKLRLFAAKHFDCIDDLALLMRADALATGMVTEAQANAKSRLIALRDRMLGDGTPLSLSDLDISGADLTDLGFEGRAVGEMLQDCWRMSILDPKLNRREWLLSYAQRHKE
ncbi:MAG: HD domain-containing protein, partial [Clostridiales bacterium]|nr:HD domain-containing protein [Clostridiales bacterium]